MYLCLCSAAEMFFSCGSSFMHKYKKYITYAVIFGITLFMEWLLPHCHMAMWRLWVLLISYSLLFTLLVWLSCRLIRIDGRSMEISLTAVFLFLFLPRGSGLLNLDIDSVASLASQCMVPFFIGQYMRIRRRDYGHIYALMLLMGIFCSYTHDGIAIPLCASFLWMSWLTRRYFFQRACWPMVIGFCLGTGLCIWQALSTGVMNSPLVFGDTLSQTTLALQTLWDTKIFLLAAVLTTWLGVNRWGRCILARTLRRHMLLSFCALFSLCTLPFAPLGLDKAAEGVCFFCLFWTLLLLRQLANKYYYKINIVK